MRFVWATISLLGRSISFVIHQPASCVVVRARMMSPTRLMPFFVNALIDNDIVRDSWLNLVVSAVALSALVLAGMWMNMIRYPS